jgi:putative photosynthetic complex assembly protein 2
VDFVFPPLFALLVWWLGTGLVIMLDSLPRRSFSYSLAGASLLAVAALMCIARSANYSGVSGAYAAFLCAVLVWAWHELTFLTGWITGPRKAACSAPADGRTRFNEGVQVILWHELSIIASGALIVWLSRGGINQVAAWTFGLLWIMRLSAKLNLFLGVRNLGEAFLPPHLLYLSSYFRRRRLNALLPLSLLAGTALAVWMVAGAAGSQGAARAGLMLVASMLVLALLEHLMMVAPMPPDRLWRWAIKPPAVSTP